MEKIESSKKRSREKGKVMAKAETWEDIEMCIFENFMTCWNGDYSRCRCWIYWCWGSRICVCSGVYLISFAFLGVAYFTMLQWWENKMGSSELWGCIEDSKVSSTTWIQSSSSSKCLSWAATSECAILTCNRLYCICSEVRPNQAGFISVFIRISSLFIMCQTRNSIYKIWNGFLSTHI